MDNTPGTNLVVILGKSLAGKVGGLEGGVLNLAGVRYWVGKM